MTRAILRCARPAAVIVLVACATPLFAGASVLSTVHAQASDPATVLHLPLALQDVASWATPPPTAPAPVSPTAAPPSSPTPPPSATPLADETERLFDPQRVLDVRLELPAAEWATLRHEVRTLRDVFGAEACASAPPESPFTYRPATITVDGTRVENVGLRKKGLLGSVNAAQPALKVKLTEYDPQQRLHGMRRMTLNSPVADASIVRQCLTYALFARAGVPAPRCNYARVRVNGEDLGPYVHVESIKKPFLRRHFADDEGNLYEGTRSDLTPEWVRTFEAKTNEQANDRADLAALVAALQAPDDALFEALEPLLDLEAFYRFWAMESLAGHSDGYTNNRNNVYLYHDPASGRFHFIPWGADGALHVNVRPPAGDLNAPRSVSAQAHLARRLYLHPEGRRRYVRQMRELLSGAWDEAWLQAEIDRQAALLRPHVPAAWRQGFQRDLDNVRGFVRDRRAQVTRELDAGGADWRYAPGGPPCRWPIGTLRASFDAPWKGGQGTARIVVRIEDGEELTLGDPGVIADDGAIRTWPRYPALTFTGTFPRATRYWQRGERLLALVFVDPERFRAGEAVPLDGASAMAWVYRQPNRPDNLFPALLWEGEVALGAAGTTRGASVEGEVETRIWMWRTRLPPADTAR